MLSLFIEGWDETCLRTPHRLHYILSLQTGLWGTCIFRSLFFARVCTPPNHPQYSIYLTGVWFMSPLLNMGIEKDIETWILWNRKDTHRVSYRTKLFTHAWFNTEEPAMNPSCVLSYGTGCICVLQWLSWMRSLNCHSLHLLAAVPCEGVVDGLVECGGLWMLWMLFFQFYLLLPLVFFSNSFIGKLFVWIIFTIPPATSAPACPRTTGNWYILLSDLILYKSANQHVTSIITGMMTNWCKIRRSIQDNATTQVCRVFRTYVESRKLFRWWTLSGPAVIIWIHFSEFHHPMRQVLSFKSIQSRSITLNFISCLFIRSRSPRLQIYFRSSQMAAGNTKLIKLARC